MSEERSELELWMQERIDENRRSLSGAALDRDVPARPVRKAKPVFGVPLSPPAIDHDDHPPEREVPVYRPFKASLPQVGQPSRALAAFRLGHRGVAMWVWAEVLWEDLVRRCCHMFCHDGAMMGIPLAADQLLEARRVLVDSINRGTYDELERAVDRFSTFNRETIQQYDQGTFSPVRYLGGDPPWESIWRELVFACGRALAIDHPLRGFFDLGVAFGEFDRLVSRYYAALYEGIKDDPPLPEIRELALRAAAIPEAVLARSPLLQSLAGIGRDYDRIGHPDAFLIYFEANEHRWEASLLGIDGLRAPGRMASAQVDLVERDLAQTSDEQWGNAPGIGQTPGSEVPGERIPRWDPRTGMLHVGTEFAFPFARQARNIRSILKAFQDQGWKRKIDNPLISMGKTDPSALTQALKAMRKKTVEVVHFFEDLGRACWEWAENSQNSP
jgi:hypothetical protein